jgi:hypothetical protein
MNTLDLKEKYERERKEKLKKTARPKPQGSKPAQAKKESAEPAKKSRASAIDELYTDNGKTAGRDEFANISQPQRRDFIDSIFGRAVLLIVLIILAGLVWGLFLRAPASPADPNEGAPGWYAVKLINDEIYYGQIRDTGADPVVIENVYYDYDQLNKKEGSGSESNNLRLVKRGQETHGPSGAMQIVRDQVVYMEPLKENSKVLRAILDYEG